MAEIQILSSEVVDQIAAGEVIERPAQMIKELVENSFDAGATKILVDFAEGGRSVRVTDNGKGMDREDLARALDRFATSKISSAGDLWKLKTFGFRGEALASIAAVSELTMTSKNPESSEAAKVVSKFGQRKLIDSVSGENGTTVVIENLFENLPARLKFLKSAASEGTQIKNVLKAMALSHPEVELRVLSRGELIYYWPATSSRLARAKQVLEIENLYEGSASREDIRAYSVFSDPQTTAKTSRNMWFFVQGRWVQDRGLQAGVQEAYRNLLMHGEYPITVSWLDADPEKVDVNIHPTKSQVKFLDPSLAFRAIQASLRETLEKAPWISQAVENYSKKELFENLATLPPAENFRFNDKALERTQFQVKTQITAPEREEERSVLRPLPAEEANLYWSQLQVLGQANLTYIITQSRDAVVFVDQHAAHERVIFEKLMRSWRQSSLCEVQDFLFPLAIDLSSEQVELLLEQEESFARLGVSLERLGPTTIGVRSAPSMLKESALSTSLEKTAQEILENGGSYSFENSVAHICATMACHSAIRAGQALSVPEMQRLLEDMDEFPLSGFCPHGRPVQVDYGFTRLERDFGRIV